MRRGYARRSSPSRRGTGRSPQTEQAAADPDDEAGDDDDEEDPHEAGAARDGHPRAQPATHQVAHGHHQGDAPDDGALRDEDDEGRAVGGDVGDAGLGGGLEEVVAEQADQADDEEAAGPRTEGAVVEADG